MKIGRSARWARAVLAGVVAVATLGTGSQASAASDEGGAPTAVPYVAPTGHQAMTSGAAARLANSQASFSQPTPPFTQCPTIGSNPTCKILIWITDIGTFALGDPALGPYDGADDTTVGVLNDSSVTVTSLPLSSATDIFGFDGDGICRYLSGASFCAGAPTGYEGPGVRFAATSVYSGTVNFTTPLTPGASTFFGLEEALDTTPGHNVITGPPPPQGGAIQPPETLGDSNPAEPHSHSSSAASGDPVNTSTGNYSQSFADIGIASRLPFGLTRTYNSLQPKDGSFGYGWSSNLEMAVTAGSGTATVTQAGGAQVVFSLQGAVYVPAARVQATLTKATDGSWTFVVGGRRTYHFDNSGRLTSESDLNANSTTVTYPSPTTRVMTDPAGRQITFTLSGTRITGLTDPAGRTVHYTYDTAGNLITVLDVGQSTTHFAYDANHRMTSAIDPRGNAVTNTYDAAGRVIAQTDRLGHATTFDYTSLPGATKIVDPNGNLTVDAYANGLLQSRAKGVGTASQSVRSYSYDPASIGITSETDGLGNVTTRTFDAVGNELTLTDPLGRTTTVTYNTFHEPLTATDASGVTNTFSYDAAGNLLSRSRPLAGTTQIATVTYGYTGHAGDVTRVTDPNGLVSTQTFDAAGNRTSVTDPAGSVTTETFDVLGRPLTAVAPKGHSGGYASLYTTTVQYDASGDITRRTDPLGHVTTTTFDANRNPIRLTDPLGRVTTTVYDAENRAIQVHRADGTTLSTSFDDNGNLVAQTDGAGHSTHYGYDALDRKISMTDPLGRVTSFGWDAAGRQVSTMTPDAKVTSFVHDDAGQLTAMHYASATTPDVTFGYDPLGRRTSMSDGTGTSTWTWDSLGRITATKDGVGLTVANAWDLGGRLTAITYPNGNTVQRGYDAAGHLTSLTDWLGQHTTFGYDANGNLTGRVDGNGVTTNRSFDAADRVTQISVTKSATNLASFGYLTDAADQLTAASTSGLVGAPASQQLGHDALDRLTAADALTYSYDAADQIVANAGTGQAFDAAGQLCVVAPTASATPCGQSQPAGSTTFTSGPNGERLGAETPSSGTLGYTYDQEHRLTEITRTTTSAPGSSGSGLPLGPGWLLPGAGLLAAGWVVTRRTSRVAAIRVAAITGVALLAGVTVACTPTVPTTTVTTVAAYTYNGEGLRVAKLVGNDARRTVWSAIGLPVQLSDGADSYVYGPGDIAVERISGTTPTFLDQDRQGSTRLLTNAAGALVGSYTFGPWGTTVSHAGTESVALQFNGQYTDGETGFQYLRARYYDPSTAQFLTRDPILPVTRSPFAYASNNPINRADPTGLCGWTDPLGCVSDAADAAGNAASWVGDKASSATGAVGDAASWVGDKAAAAGSWAWQHRDTIATIAAIGTCLIPAVGLVGCAVAGALAFGVRAECRVEREGFSKSLTANLADGGLTYLTLGLGGAFEAAGEGVPAGLAYSGRLIPAGYDAAAGGGDIAGGETGC